jgi:S4 domain protein YaaA
VEIEGPFITLGQLLKKLDLIDSGGQAKFFLQEVEVKVNREMETRRGRKIYPQDVVEIPGFGSVQVIGE